MMQLSVDCSRICKFRLHFLVLRDGPGIMIVEETIYWGRDADS